MAAKTERAALVTSAEAAVYLARNRRTLANWRAKGEGPGFVGRGQGVRYELAELDRWIAANRH